MNRAQLQAYQQGINASLLHDPVGRLAYTAAMLDPGGIFCHNTELFETEDPINAFYVARHAFPDIYIDACKLLLENLDIHKTADAIAWAIAEDVGLEEVIHGYESIWWGFGLPCYYIDIDFQEMSEDFVAEYNLVAELFGRSTLYDLTPLDILAGEYIFTTLPDGGPWRNIHWLLRRLLGISDNVCIDYDEEMLWSMEPIRWEPEAIDEARAEITAARNIIARADSGLKTLNNSPAMVQILRSNIRWVQQKLTYIQQQIKTEKVTDVIKYIQANDQSEPASGYNPLGIEWPDPA